MIIHLITASNNSQNLFIIYIIDLSTTRNVKIGVHSLTKIKNTDDWKKKKKKYFTVISFREFLNFPTWAFSENVQCFVGVFL